MKVTDSKLRSIIRIAISETIGIKNESLESTFGADIGQTRSFSSDSKFDNDDEDQVDQQDGIVFPIRRVDRPSSYGPFNLRRPPIPSLAAKYAPDGPEPNPRLYNRYSNYNQHLGIDIGVPVGTDVLAPVSGEVIGSSGHTMKILGTDGREYTFNHLDSFLYSTGQNVSAGQVVAKSGNKGPSTGPHLHFAVKQNGTAIDPMRLYGSTSIAGIA
tara:strand:- start:5306 stop:5947 length:642 start_codon:yes stop_codon:yes gene_type:complete